MGRMRMFDYIYMELGKTINTYWDLLWLCCLLITMMIFAYIIQILVHEGGHLLFGLIVGYHFLSFRLFDFAVVKQDGLKIKKYHCPGSFGQCIITPPTKRCLTKRKRFLLPVLGGVLINGILAVFVFPLVIYPGEISFLVRMAAFWICFYGIGFVILNGVPMKGKKISNDGMAAKELYKSLYARDCYDRQMMIARDLIQGLTYGELPKHLIEVKEGADMTNSIIAYHKILEYYYYLDQFNDGKAQDTLQSIIEHMEVLPKWIRNTVKEEQLYLAICKEDQKSIRTIYKEIKPIIMNGKGDMNLIRVQLSYDIYKNRDKTKEYEVLVPFYLQGETYPYQGEVTFCTRQVKRVIQRYVYSR